MAKNRSSGRRRLLKRVVRSLVGGVLVALAALFVMRPWAVTIIREGFPTSEWPGNGEFVSQGDVQAAPGDHSGSFGASDEFLDRFDTSDGAAFVVMREGEIVFAHFGADHSAQTKFNSYSMVKSLIGALVIKAISDGEIEGLDVTVAELWDASVGTPVGDLTVGELLDMESGIIFEADEGDPESSGRDKDALLEYGPFSEFARMHVEGPDSLIGEVQVSEVDRGRYAYQNINTAILGRILEETYDMPLDELLYEMIAAPAGAGGFYWRQYSSDARPSAYCCLYATAEWWLKVGNYLMNNGLIDNGLVNNGLVDNGPTIDGTERDPFLSPEWFAYFMGDDLTDEEVFEGHYRSQNRYNVLDREGEQMQGRFVYFAGRGGQITYLIPSQDMVVVRFGDDYQLLHSTLYDISDLAQIESSAD